MGGPGLRHRHRPRTDLGGGTAGAQEASQIEERQQADGQPPEQHGPEPERRSPGGPPFVNALHGRFQGGEGLVEDLEQQEQEDPRRSCVEEGLQSRGRTPEPAQGQAQEDRGPSDEPEQRRLGEGHGSVMVRWAGHRRHRLEYR